MSKIKEARLKAGLSQAQMSEIFEIPKRTIEDWDRGARQCPRWAELLIVEKLERLATEHRAGKEEE